MLFWHTRRKSLKLFTPANIRVIVFSNLTQQTISTAMKREYSLDLARLVAAYCVLFSHFVLSGTFDETSRTWTGSTESLPLLSKSSQSLWMLDTFMLGKWQTAVAIWGVALFFLISGWVVPPMLSRYSRQQFLINRLFRIFPMLIFAVIMAATIQYLFGDRHSLSTVNVLSTMTLTSQFFGYPLTLAVVWTLLIEFKFYLLITLLGHLNCKKILSAASLMLLLLIFQINLVRHGVYSTSPQMLSITNAFAHDFCFMIFMLCGSALFLIVNNTKPNFKTVGTLFLILSAYNIYRYLCINQLGIQLHQDINVATQIIAGLFFGLCLLTNKCFSGENALTHAICKLSNVTYSLYLLHVPIGFFLLSRLRHFIDNQYFLLVVVTLSVSLIAAVTYRLIELPGNRLGKTLLIPWIPRKI
ncbi:acyltransferase [Citrobacter sp. Cy234]|uniref:acyltransferase family protein n=1 Tax=Citrobacter TaxID=544 RepID=UPI001E4FAF85|nr:MULTISPECIES: acyltransferase [Citrobacter]MDK2554404.1 acyltransferase [Citrobacter youngae]MDL4456203.1 acyltransferase [Citrobacter youngae]MDM2716491.1 acyltransferase [Citrobacter sp. Cy232]MDM2719589.1 acyltransferase [Citrobacter sp. Cy230]MDM2726569.1 acyltransferase [Citrobacter sp. Cy234]